MASTKKTSKKKNKEKPIFECPHCDKILTDQSSYFVHVQLHKEEFPYSCDQCSYKAKIKKYLSRHKKKVHSRANGPQCPICRKVFHFDCNLRNHMRVHTGEKPHQCQVCGKAFSSTYCLSMHKMIHTDEKPYQCSFCPYACRDSSTLRKHQERHMGILNNHHPCNKCKKIFKTKRTLKFHIEEVHYGIETRRFVCEHCNKGFKTKANLNIHVKTVHEKACQTECEICGKVLNKNNFSTHLKTHVDIRPYKCSFKSCAKKFKDPSTLKKHILIHYPKYQYKCDLCDSRFPRKLRLREHRMRHLADGRYTCDYCGITFLKKVNLSSHITKKHRSNSEKYICDDCGLVNYSKRAIILHLKYGHGTEQDTICRICSKMVANSDSLKRHYLKLHNVRYTVQKKEDETIRIKDEPLEVCAEFDFNYDVQKIEIDTERIPDPEYMETDTSLAYSEKVLEEIINRTMCDPEDRPQTEFDQFYLQQIVNKPAGKEKSPEPEYAGPEATQEYSSRVLAEDISRTLEERESQEKPESEFDEFFLQQAAVKPRKKVPPKQIVDEQKLKNVNKIVKKMLNESKIREEVNILEKMRQSYNKRIQMANQNSGKKVPTQIKYLKMPEGKTQNTQTPENNNTDDKIVDYRTDSSQKGDEDNSSLQRGDEDDSSQNGDQDNPSSQKGDKDNSSLQKGDEDDSSLKDEDISSSQKDDNDNSSSQKGDKDNSSSQNGDKDNSSFQEDYSSQKGEDISPSQKGDEHDSSLQKIDKDNSSLQKGEEDNKIDDDSSSQKGDEDIYDMPLSRRITRKRKVKRDKSDEDHHDNGKIKLNGFECYICFKLFKTKADLKLHCKDHFNICNEKMLKKCPFCGYVTQLNIKKHLELVHKFNINYAYGQVTEKENAQGSKYYFEIDDDCELEIIPSINNLNRIACMKFDEKKRQNKNAFLGKTKLVKKGTEWVVEKQAISLSDDNLLPVFTDEEYKKLKGDGNSYVDRLKKLSVLAKKHGVKMLFPCNGCEKICQTASALKLHERKHEANPKRFKPKVWKNRHIEYITKNRKKVRCSNKTKKKKLKKKENENKFACERTKKPVRYLPVKGLPNVSENRYAAPQPVKNKHKCDKELIKFYESNIKGKDIEFWQFLKIYNKMSRENVNDFKDLENRDDLHFGLHIKQPDPVISTTEPVNTGNKPKCSKNQPVNTGNNAASSSNQPINTKNVSVGDGSGPVKTGKVGKNCKKSFTRAIMISKKEYLRRNAIKNQMRMRLEENQSK